MAARAQSAARTLNRKRLFTLVGALLLFAVGSGLLIQLNVKKRQAFVRNARGVCARAAWIDRRFAGLMRSHPLSRDQVLNECTRAVTKLDGLQSEIGATEPSPGRRGVQNALCLAVGEHRKAYEAIREQFRTAMPDSARTRRALGSASEKYRKVDSELVPDTRLLPALAVEDILKGCQTILHPPVVTETSEGGVSPPGGDKGPKAGGTKPKGHVCKTCGKSFASRKARGKDKNTHKNGVYRCKWCKAWFVNAKLLARHTKVCIEHKQWLQSHSGASSRPR